MLLVHSLIASAFPALSAQAHNLFSHNGLIAGATGEGMAWQR